MPKKENEAKGKERKPVVQFEGISPIQAYTRPNVCVECQAAPKLTVVDYENKFVSINPKTKEPTIYFRQKHVSFGLCYFCSRQRRRFGEAKWKEEKISRRPVLNI